MKTNYRLKDGDTVKLKTPAKVDGYWFCADAAPRGCWESHYMLTGCIGRVVKARTPKVTTKKGESPYFANVDIEHNGTVSRVRVDHSDITRVRS